MKEHYPTRQFQHYDLLDEVTDIVVGSDGREHLITMRGWHWNNLDWIKRNTKTTEQNIVDISVMGTYGTPNATLSKSMEASIYFYIENIDNAIKGNTAKDISGEKGTIGRA